LKWRIAKNVEVSCSVNATVSVITAVVWKKTHNNLARRISQKSQSLLQEEKQKPPEIDAKVIKIQQRSSIKILCFFGLLLPT
jgi:hypothetical protein